jgi:hypothetical protein
MRGMVIVTRPAICAALREFEDIEVFAHKRIGDNA